MSIINDSKVLEVLQDNYFDHHVAMHLCREGLIPPPGDKCDCCDGMAHPGTPGSGREFLDMHHEMIRVFEFLLDKQRITYKPVGWHPDAPLKLPPEIIDLFRIPDPRYLERVFQAVKQSIANAETHADTAIDDLGILIEKENNEVPGAGFHNTFHEYMGSKEGGFAAGAEMNKLRDSMNNEYFWSLHHWIDAQYQRMVEKLGGHFDNKPLDPDSAECCTAKNHHPPKGKSHAAMAGM